MKGDHICKVPETPLVEHLLYAVRSTKCCCLIASAQRPREGAYLASDWLHEKQAVSGHCHCKVMAVRVTWSWVSSAG